MIEYSVNAHWSDQLGQLWEFLGRWYGSPIRGDSGESTSFDESISVPRCLEEFYRRVGDIERVTMYNRFLSSSEVYDEQGKIVFYVENQNVTRWACVPTTGDNPRVCWDTGQGERWQFEGEPLSGFLYQVCVYEAMARAEYQCYQKRFSHIQRVNRVLSEWTLAPFCPWYYKHYPTSFYSRDNALGILYADGTGLFQFACGAHCEDHLLFMRDLVDDWDEWENMIIPR